MSAVSNCTDPAARRQRVRHKREESTEHSHGRKFIVEQRGDRTNTVDSQDNVGSRKLDHGQKKFERTRHEIDRDSLGADVVAVEENDAASPTLLTRRDGSAEIESLRSSIKT